MPAFSEAAPPSIERLRAFYRRKGYEVDRLFADPRFTVHEGIDDFFRKSAERAGADEYRAALKSGNKAKAELVFRQEYEKYKAKLKFEAKRDSLPMFMEEHAAHLARCEKEYGVPREILAAVMGIESDFGQNRGSFRAFNVYVSLYLKNYRREFAVSQLSELLAFCKRTGADVFDLHSSYAGAIGYMQFLPYSLNHWFVGKDVYDMGDAVASAANYLSHFQKRRGSMEKALYSYNPSRYYVTFVLELAGQGKAGE
jgi:membrane-bound lytic murein transglycosylase B